MPLFKATATIEVVFCARDEQDALKRCIGALAEEVRMNGLPERPALRPILSLTDVPNGWAGCLPWYGDTDDTVGRLIETGSAALPAGCVRR